MDKEKDEIDILADALLDKINKKCIMCPEKRKAESKIQEALFWARKAKKKDTE